MRVWICMLTLGCSSAHMVDDSGMDASASDARMTDAHDVGEMDACPSLSCCADEDCTDRGRRGRCMASGCVSSAECVDGLGDCDDDESNGCETILDAEPNCGGCGVTCAEDGYCEGGRCLRDAEIAVSTSVTCVLDRRGRIECAGSDAGIGDGIFDHTAMGFWPTSFGEPAREISSALAGLSFDGVVKSWNGFIDESGEFRWLLSPQIVEGLPPIRTLGDATSGAFVNCAIDREDAVWCWGSNQHGVVDWDEPAMLGLPPRSIEGLPAAVQRVASTSTHACALADVDIYCWGRGGDGSYGGPMRVDLPPARDIAVGSLKTCVIDLEGGLWCFGQELTYVSDVLGDYPPTRVPGLPPIASVDAHSELTCAADVDGGVWCFGFHSQVLLAEEEDRHVRFPERVLALPPPVEVTVTGITAKHACAISHGAREVWCWGRELDGSFGHTDHDPDVPVTHPPTLVYEYD